MQKLNNKRKNVDRKNVRNVEQKRQMSIVKNKPELLQLVTVHKTPTNINTTLTTIITNHRHHPHPHALTGSEPTEKPLTKKQQTDKTTFN